jgi:FkbM family methyltransferase
MPASSTTVSVILPTFNRAGFLAAALQSIRAQTYPDWELVIIDDGSTDDSREVVDRLTHDIVSQVTYRYQDNKGPYPARNAGLDFARGSFVAFFDSDDIWLPHHLARCVEALIERSEVDCVYAACRIVDYPTGRVLTPTTFEDNGQPLTFRRLKVRRAGDLHIFDDPDLLAVSIRHGLYCGLQNAVFRASIFEDQRFEAAYRNEAEDRLFVSRAIARGHQFAYLTDVHVQYHVHDANSSAANANQDIDRQLRVLRPIVQGYEDLRQQIPLTPAVSKAIGQRILQEAFWHIGYALLWSNGRRPEALEAFKQGLAAWPWDVRAWKTYLLARARVSMSFIWLKVLGAYLRTVPAHPGRWRLAVQAVALAPVLRSYLKPVIVRTHEGFRLRVDGSSQTGRILYATGRYEAATSAVITSRVKPGQLVVDVGANIGYFTVLAAHAVGRDGAVMAFEPNVDVRKRLEDNIRLNALTNVEVHGEALGERAGEVMLYVGPPTDTGLASLRALPGSRTVRVPLVRFDDLARPGDRPVRLIKVDVEGAEFAVIEGMMHCLSRDRPDLIMEITDEYLQGLNASARVLYERLAALGYYMFEIRDDGRLEPIRTVDALAHCPTQFNALWSISHAS